MTAAVGERRRERERGSAAVEVVALVPVLVFVATLVLQLGVAGWTASQTQNAARQAARAQSLDRDPREAAQAALPGALRIDRLETSDDSVTLFVRVPKVSLLPSFTVERNVAMADAP